MFKITLIQIHSHIVQQSIKILILIRLDETLKKTLNRSFEFNILIYVLRGFG